MYIKYIRAPSPAPRALARPSPRTLLFACQSIVPHGGLLHIFRHGTPTARGPVGADQTVWFRNIFWPTTDRSWDSDVLARVGNILTNLAWERLGVCAISCILPRCIPPEVVNLRHVRAFTELAPFILLLILRSQCAHGWSRADRASAPHWHSKRDYGRLD